MKNFREFKENIVSKIREKVAAALEVKKQEMARSMFNESTDLDEAPRPRLARPSKTANFVVHYKINGKEEEKFILVPNEQKAKEWVLNKISDAGGKGKLIKITPIDESTDLNEGMGAFKAAAEVLKAFGGKKPSKMSDMMKFDSEIEKAAKKYDVSVDDILKVINK